MATRMSCQPSYSPNLPSPLQISPVHPRALLFCHRENVRLVHLSLVGWFSSHYDESIACGFGHRHTQKGIVCVASLKVGSLTGIDTWEESDYCDDFDFWAKLQSGENRWRNFTGQEEPFYDAMMDLALTQVTSAADPDETLSIQAKELAKARHTLIMTSCMDSAALPNALRDLATATAACQAQGTFTVSAALQFTPTGECQVQLLLPPPLLRSSFM
jgi:hypothetical protein